jgi:hypothetical protein
MRERKIRRPIAVLTLSVLMVALTAGVALAATVYCSGGLCWGTNTADVIWGT